MHTCASLIAYKMRQCKTFLAPRLDLDSSLFRHFHSALTLKCICELYCTSFYINHVCVSETERRIRANDREFNAQFKYAVSIYV